MPVVTRGMPNKKAMGPDSLQSELLKIDHAEFIRYLHNLVVNVRRTGDVPPAVETMRSLRSLIKRLIEIWVQQLPRDFTRCAFR